MGKVKLIKKGISDPLNTRNFLINKFRRRLTGTKEDTVYSAYKHRLYRRWKRIETQKRMIHELIDEEEFVLIILDACRYDYFSEEIFDFLEGELTKVWSAGNATTNWTAKTWTGKYDIDYISANYRQVQSGAYKEKWLDFEPEKTFENRVFVRTNDILAKTSAERVTDIALQHFANQNKVRGVVHYVQPHAPYIGRTKILQWKIRSDDLLNFSDVQKQLDKQELNYLEKNEYIPGEDLLHLDIPEDIIENIGKKREKVWDREAKGDISEESLRQAYRDNLRYVLKEVKRLIQYTNCEVVISSDHGEHLGEARNELPRLGHPKKTHPVLREIPWFVVNDSTLGRKPLEDIKVRDDYWSSRESSITEQDVEENLKSLGYL